MKNNIGIIGSNERFGYEWNKYNMIIPEYEEQFLKWVFPLAKKDFCGKVILDAGCGTGRNSLWPLYYGAKKVIAHDYNFITAKVAKNNLRLHKNAIVYCGSIYSLPHQEKFDIALSIGVIHHLENPRAAVKQLVIATKKGGTVLVWVYGCEGNNFAINCINLIRKITSKTTVKMVHTIAYFFSVPLYIYLKLTKPKSAYFKQLSSFKFWHVHSIVFDQLIPKIANYWLREEVISLFDGLPVENIRAFRVNNNSWTIVCKRSII